MKFTSDFSATSAPHRARHGWLPQWLFRAGGAGAWYDPSDLSTLFQDAVGTTPVTAAGHPVGLMLDKSGNGNDASQATAAKRPTYGVAPAGGVRNLLTYSEDLSNVVWRVASLDVVPSESTAKLVPSVENSTHVIWRDNITVSAGATLTSTIDVNADGYGFFALAIHNGAITPSNEVIQQFDLSAGTVGSSYNTAPTTSSIKDLGNGWYRISITWTFSGTAAGISWWVTEVDQNPRSGFLGDGTSGVIVRFPQVEVSAVATNYQKVLSSYDVTEAGVTSVSYLSFDGVDDFLTLGDVLGFGTSDITVAFGVDSNSAAIGGLVSKRGTGSGGNNPGWGLRSASNQLNLEYDDGVIGLAPAPIGETNGMRDLSVHVAEIEHGVSARSYRNAVLSAMTADISAFGDVTGTQELTIGKEPTGIYKFTGNIFGIVIREGLLTSGDRDRLTHHIAARSGVTL